MLDSLGRLCAVTVTCLTIFSAHGASQAPRLVVQSGPRAIQFPQLVVSPDRSLVASTGEFGRGAVSVWHVATGRLLCTLPAQLEGFGAGMMGGGGARMAFSKDASKLATPSAEGALQLWDLRRCEKHAVVQVAAGRKGRERARGMLLTGKGDLTVLGADGALFEGDVFAGKALRALGKAGGSSEVLHGTSADGRFVLASGKADGVGPFSGWITRVIDAQTGSIDDLSSLAAASGTSTPTAMPPIMAQIQPPAAAMSPSGRWVLTFRAGEVQLIDRSRRVLTGSASMLQATAQPAPPRPAAAPEAQPPSGTGMIRGCPPPAGAEPQAQARCDRLEQAMRTLGGGRVAEMRAAVEQMKQQAQQGQLQEPAAVVPPWFGFSEREDAVYIWRNPSPTVAGPLRPDQRSVIDVRKLPDLALVRQIPVHDADPLTPFFGAMATGFGASQDGRMLAVGLMSVDMGAGRLGVVDLVALGERAELRTWKPSGGLPAGLEWTSDDRLIGAISGQRGGAVASLALRGPGPGPGGARGLPPGMIPGMPPPDLNAAVVSTGTAIAPSPGSVVSTVVQWPMTEGEVTSRRVGTTGVRPVRLSPGGAFAAVMKVNADAITPVKSRSTIEIIATTGMQHVREVELVDHQGAALWTGAAGGAEHFAISADGQRIAAMTRLGKGSSSQGSSRSAGQQQGRLSVHDAMTGKPLAAMELSVATGIEFLGTGGSSLLVGTSQGRQCVTLTEGQIRAVPFKVKNGPLAVFGGDPMHAVAADVGGGIDRCGAVDVKWIRLAGEGGKVMQLDASGTKLAVAREGAVVDLYEVKADGGTTRSGELLGHQGDVVSMAFSPDGSQLATMETTGATYLWNLASRTLMAKLFAFEDGTWAVVDAQGRFDTNNIEDLEHLHWVMPDDALRALPLEIFMRDHFSPGLLGRVIRGDPMPPVRAVGELNRAQPILRIASVKPARSDPRRVDVTVEVEGQTDVRGRAGGVIDVRLFREGRLVGYPTRPGEALRLDPKTNRATLTFPGIRLPQGKQTVAFSAYAFNTDRVKSATVRSVYQAAATAGTKATSAAAQGKAYVITIGVNKYDNAAFDLRYAANDARLTTKLLSERITAQRSHREVVPVTLLSEGEGLRDATKARIRAVVDVLGGRPADRKELAGVANASRLEAATPDDLVILAFAGHGHAGEAGVFHLLPQDIVGSDTRVTPELLARSISTDELEAWLRDVDAGELALVIDACYSAASVEGRDFKPGPMGSRGLGQLAYDKGMRILAASQTSEAANEVSVLEHGMLTFALMRDGIGERRADFRPQDDRIRLGEWLAYGVEGVPRLERELAKVQRTAKRADRSVTRIGVVDAVARQQPRLFDYARQGDGPVIESKR